MTDLTRRFFLGGAISLLAVQTSAMPKLVGNMPQIWGDGRHDDANGIGALLRNEPVIFSPDKITVDSHRGITFHKGTFGISRTIEIPEECNLVMDGPNFRSRGLPLDDAFFRAPLSKGVQFAPDQFARVWFSASYEQKKFIEYPAFNGQSEFEEEMFQMAAERTVAA